MQNLTPNMTTPSRAAQFQTTEGNIAANTQASEPAKRKSAVDRAIDYELGQNGKAIDLFKARKILSKAASDNDLQALNNLGNMHLYGYGGEKNIDAAISCFEKALAGGFNAAHFNLGMIYHHHVAASDLAITHFEAIFADQKSDLAIREHAALQLVDLYFNKNNWLKAQHYADFAVGSNDQNIKAQALNFVATIESAKPADERDASKIIRFLEESFNLGNRGATTNLGIIYEQGILIKHDAQLMRRYYELAAQKDNDIHSLKRLGLFYAKGLYAFDKNLELAISYFKRAADQGDQDAQNNLAGSYNNLAKTYERGDGVEQDIKKAAEYYGLALENCKDGTMEKIIQSNILRILPLFEIDVEYDPDNQQVISVNSRFADSN